MLAWKLRWDIKYRKTEVGESRQRVAEEDGRALAEQDAGDFGKLELSPGKRLGGRVPEQSVFVETEFELSEMGVAVASVFEQRGSGRHERESVLAF